MVASRAGGIMISSLIASRPKGINLSQIVPTPYIVLPLIAIKFALCTTTAIETVSPEGTFCDTLKVPFSDGDMELN